ncbi:MAG: leucine-rich repeat protein, partial [Spirochaetales bacterium]|nr:leucine-rich repeat protein [Candidatus Physcosoma equi]
IANKAFWFHNEIHSVSFPVNLTKIGDYAFAFCSELKTISYYDGDTVVQGFPPTLSEIGRDAFSTCINLKPTTKIIRYDLPYTYEREGEKDQNFLVIPASVKTIGQNAFYKCSSLENVLIKAPSSNVDRVIPEFAFDGCLSLRHVYIEDAVSIGGNAFGDCKVLEKLFLQGKECDVEANPNMLLNSDFCSFYRIVPGGEIKLIQYYLTKDPETNEVVFQSYTGQNYKGDDDGMYRFRVPDETTKIAKGAFKDCSYLDTVIIPKSVKEIESGAFNNCKILKNIIFEGEAEDTQEPLQFGTTGSVFIDCPYLVELDFNARETVVADGALNGSYLRDIKLPEGLTEITTGFFSNWNGVIKIVIPKTVTRIESGAFDNCPALERVEFEKRDPLSTLVLGSQSASSASSILNNCPKLKVLELPDGTTEIGYGAFKDTSLEKVSLPSTIAYVGAKAFENCSSLTNVTFRHSDESYLRDGKDVSFAIPDDMFFSCGSLRSITVPNYAKSIGAQAFKYTSISSVTFEKGGHVGLEIMTNAFAGTSTQLTTLDLPARTWKVRVGAFRESNFTSIVFDDISSTDFLSESTYNPSTREYGAYPLALEIEPFAFTDRVDVPKNYDSETLPSENKILTYVKLPHHTVSLGCSAFANCRVLEKVEWGKRATGDSRPIELVFEQSKPTAARADIETGSYPFLRCIVLEEIFIPNTVHVLESRIAKHIRFIGSKISTTWNLVFEEEDEYSQDLIIKGSVINQAYGTNKAVNASGYPADTPDMTIILPARTTKLDYRAFEATWVSSSKSGESYLKYLIIEDGTRSLDIMFMGQYSIAGTPQTGSPENIYIPARDGGTTLHGTNGASDSKALATYIKNIVFGNREGGKLSIDSYTFNKMGVLRKIASAEPTEVIDSVEALEAVLRRTADRTAYLPDCLVKLGDNAFVSPVITTLSIPSSVTVGTTGVSNTVRR